MESAGRNIIAIDPGTEHSGVVCYDRIERRVMMADDKDNNEILSLMRNGWIVIVDAVLAIEDIEPMGFAVGVSTLTTKEWIGRFREAWERRGGIVEKVSRGDVKVALCGGSTYKDPATGKRKKVSDAQVRRALLDRFPQTGGGAEPAIGTKRQPGPLHGISGHAFSALAVAVLAAKEV